MRHAKPYRKLSRQRSHYRALLRNLAAALFQHERIETTLIKAKEIRPFVDKIITLGRKGGLHNRRRAFSLLGNKIINPGGQNRLDVLDKVFGELATRLKDRNGGYTRIIKLGTRPGDAAPMAIMEIIGAQLKVKTEGDSDSAGVEKKASSSTKKKAAPTRAKKTKKSDAEEKAA